MPDLTNRTERERQLATALLLLFERHGRAIQAVWPRAPDWKGMERDTHAALAAVLAGTFTEAASGMHGAPDARRWGQAWADGYASVLAGEIVATTREDVASVSGTSPAEEAAALAAVIAALAMRAENIAVTETTRAITSGERIAVEQYEMSTGTRFRPIWQTELDARTCDVCRPLDGTGEEVFGRVAPTGPPVHPRCRCYLEWEVIAA
jgi:hypothetical protein